MKELINWKKLSLELSGNDNSIRKNKIPQKYKRKVDRLLKIVNVWLKLSK